MLLSSGCLVIAAFLASILLMKLPYHPTRSRFLEWTQSENFNEFLMTSCWLFGRLQSIQPSFVQAWSITAAAITMSNLSWCYNTLLCHLRLGVAFTNSQSFFIKCDHCKLEKTIQQLLWQCTHSDVQCQPFWSVPEVDLLQRLRSWVLGHINQESYTCSNDSKINQSEKDTYRHPLSSIRAMIRQIILLQNFIRPNARERSDADMDTQVLLVLEYVTWANCCKHCKTACIEAGAWASGSAWAANSLPIICFVKHLWPRWRKGEERTAGIWTRFLLSS